MERTLDHAPKSLTRSRTGSLKYIVGGFVFFGVIAFALFNTFQSNTIYYYTLSEIAAQRADLIGRTVRVNGPLDKTSIKDDPKNLVLEFNLVESEMVLPVVYHGVAPDTLGIGESVVAEGKLGADGVFRAHSILVKCPSKYEESSVQ